MNLSWHVIFLNIPLNFTTLKLRLSKKYLQFLKKFAIIIIENEKEKGDDKNVLYSHFNLYPCLYNVGT